MSRGLTRLIPPGVRRWLRAAALEALAHPALRTERLVVPRAGPRPRVHIGVNYFGAGNIGDDLMLAGFLRAMGPRLHRLSLTCCTPYDLASQRRRFPAITWLPDDEATREHALADADAWLALGDTPFQLLSGPWMRDHLASQVDAAAARSLPMFYLGAGAEGLEVFADPTFRALAAGAERVWCRDAASARALTPHVSGAVAVGADLCHAFLGDRTWPPPVGVAGPAAPVDLGLVLAFERYDEAFDAAAVSRVIDAVPRVAWLVQEVRDFPGSERHLLTRLTAAAASRVHVATPDYAGASTTAALLAAWPACTRAATSRYHALQILAWRGARLVAVSRSGKIAGAAEDLGVPHVDLSALPEALPDARAVPPERLASLARAGSAMVDDFCRTLQLDRRVPAPRRDAEAPSRIAVVKLDGIGDFVLATSFLRALRTLWPQARVTAFVRPAVAPIARCCPAVDAVEVVDSPHAQSPALAGPFDMVFVPRASTDHLGGLEVASRMAAPVRVGFARTAPVATTAAAFTLLVPQPRPASHARINLQLLWPFTSQPLDDRLLLQASDAACARWAQMFAEAIRARPRPLCLVGIGAGHPWKCWPIERFAEVVAQARDVHGLVPVIVGTPEESPLAEQLLTAESRGVVNAVGASADDLCALASLAALYVGNDTGPKHVAAAFGARVVEVNPFLTDDATFAESHAVYFRAHGVPSEVLTPPPGMPRGAVERGDAVRAITTAEVAAAMTRVLAADV